MFSIGDVVSNTSHCWRIYFLSPTDFLSWRRFNYDVYILVVVWLHISITSASYLRQHVFIIHFTVLFVIAFSAFHSIRSRIFHPLSHTSAAFSSLAFSTSAFFDGAAFSVLAFSVLPLRYYVYTVTHYAAHYYTGEQSLNIIYFALNFTTRFANWSLGNSNENNSRQALTVSILFVLQSFTKKFDLRQSQVRRSGICWQHKLLGNTMAQEHVYFWSIVTRPLQYIHAL